jgi:cyclic beta-1,2-glucan synthetase
MDNVLFRKIELGHHAKSLANRFPRIQGTPRADLIRRFEQNKDLLFKAYHLLNEFNDKEFTPNPAIEWFLDNFYLIREQITFIENHYTRKYNRSLPISSEGQRKNAPRIYNVVFDFITHLNGNFEFEDLGHFVREFQKFEPLTLGELWATPIMLRLAIIEKLRILGVELLAQSMDRKNARFWFLHFQNKSKEPSGKILNLIREMARSEPTLTPAFVAEFSRCCQSHELNQNYSLVSQWLEMKLKENSTTTDSLIRKQHRYLSRDQGAIANLIHCLRLIGQINWLDFTEDQSLVEKMLRTDPAQIYPEMDFQTRDRCRRQIEILAKQCGQPETIIASHLIDFILNEKKDLSEHERPRPNLKKHVGYYLLDEGLREFLSYLKVSPSFLEVLLLFGRRQGFWLFFLSTTSVNLFLSYKVTNTLRANGPMSLLVSMLVFASVFLLTSQLVLAFVFAFFHRIIKPNYLSRMNYKKGLPESAKTLVVVPTLLLNPEGILSLIDDLEIRFLGNQDPLLYFALLTDFSDAPAESLPKDSALTKLAKEGIQRLNKKYALQGGSRFFLFHRRRLWNPQEQKWMGYERKRGKLENLNQFLLSNNFKELKETLFAETEGRLSDLEQIQYIITLDTDTQLPPGTALKLIGNLDHPLNKPEFDPAGKTLKRGYSLLQPAMGTSLSMKATTPYFELLNPDPGINPYTKLVSDIYQDFFDEGSYIGKGIYHLKTFHLLMEGRFPENRILSHDLIEGCMARSGLVTDVMLFEDQPHDFVTDTLRHHRWTRGDWQIASWLLRRVPTFGGKKLKNPLSPLSRWKIFDNLRRSVVPLGAMFLVYWFLFETEKQDSSSIVLLTLLIGPFLFGVLDQALMSFSNTVRKSSKFPTMQSFVRPFLQGIYQFTVLPIQAFQNLDAIGRSLYRLHFSKKRLLEWTCFQSLRTSNNYTLKSYYQLFLTPSLFIFVSFFFYLWRQTQVGNHLEIFQLGSTFVGIGIFSLWALGPAVAWKLSQPFPQQQTRVTTQDRLYLQQLANQISNYFTTFESDNTHWLPPDNIQENPELKVAPRTSPTNIGFSFLSALAGFDLGFISTDQLVSKLHHQFASLNRMERHRGHFLNWYDTSTLHPLLPKYVSTVDSGNFISCIYVLREALTDLFNSEKERPHHEKIKSLLEQLKSYLEADFEVLYDPNVKLFTIGFNLTEHKRDTGYYDLLASEARLTSYLAIVRNQAPLEHWFSLGRSLAYIRGSRALVSWSGSLFEYLMPNLFLPFYRNSLLDESCRTALRTQIDYGEALGIPWGMSESGYSATDQEMNYQYRAFGAPELGLKRDLQNELVIAPYASVLGLMLDPKAALGNLHQLEKEGMRGNYGFYEAMDYTTHRLPKTERQAIVKSYMAHHQGMSLVAIANILNDSVMIKRFMRAPEFKTHQILLQEVAPKLRPVRSLEFEVEAIIPNEAKVPKNYTQEYLTVDEVAPRAALLSNGSYHTLLTNTGCGFSRWNQTVVNPWRGHIPQYLDGIFFYISDLQTKQIWSNSFHPTQVKTKKSEAYFYDSRVEFSREHLGIHCNTEVTISPMDPIELRSLTLTNNSQTVRALKVTSYVEVALDTNNSFLSHPAFSKLFIDTSYAKRVNALFAHRRKRTNKDLTNIMVHFLTCDKPEYITEITYETDRQKFIGREGSTKNPKLIQESLERSLSNSVGTPLDPMLGIQAAIELPPGCAVSLHYYVGISDCVQKAEILVSKYSNSLFTKQIPNMAWIHSKAMNAQVGLNDEESLLFSRLGHFLILPDRLWRGYIPTLADIHNRSLCDLWSYGISAEKPIVLVSISSIKSHGLIRQMIRAHRYLQNKGLFFDLIFLSTEEVSYRREISDFIKSLLNLYSPFDTFQKPNGLLVKRSGEIKPIDRILLKYFAIITLLDTEGTLETQLNRIDSQRKSAPFRSVENLRDRVLPLFRPSSSKSPAIVGNRPQPLVAPNTLSFFNGIGGFSNDGREYWIFKGPGIFPSLPWVNVIANEKMGTVMSDKGSSYTWFENAHEFRITPWFNDFVEDPSGELLYLRDDVTGEVWSPLPYSRSSINRSFLVKHGFGYTCIESSWNGVDATVTIFIAPHSAMKVIFLELRNATQQTRSISATYFAQLTMGEHCFQNQNQILTGAESASGFLYARNLNSVDFPDCISYLMTNETITSYSCDSEYFFGTARNLESPGALLKKTFASLNSGSNQPSFAIQGNLEISPSSKKDLSFFLGATRHIDDLRNLAFSRPSNAWVLRQLDAVKEEWNKDLSKIMIFSDDPSLDFLCNGWLLYQTLSARFYGRTGFYQSGGAYGFRDQLQDAMALVYTRADLLRDQILRCAAVQFKEGDVLHWWHPPNNKGVRTRISDDLLWLPLALARYVKITGDSGILDERRAYLQGESVPTTSESLYTLFSPSDQDGTVYEHCVRAIRKSFQFGRHGLPLMGGGDWNDGMNEVGHLGKGESVWLGFFLHEVIKEFLTLCQMKNDSHFAAQLQAEQQKLSDNIDKFTWDGEWYRRAYFDDGSPLGSRQASECQIDLLPQCWSVLSQVGPNERMRTAMEAVSKRLIDEEAGLIRLLDPPFEGTGLNPGYIKGYLPGTRENGAQYTHAAVWTIMAFIKLGFPDRAWKYFCMINPIRKGGSASMIQTYLVEPYVVAADVYSRAPHQGRGGWTWYTGSAAWMYRLLIEYFIGFEIKDGKWIRFTLNLPQKLRNVKVQYRFRNTLWTFLLNQKPRTEAELSEPIAAHPGAWIELIDDGCIHEIEYGGQ